MDWQNPDDVLKALLLIYSFQTMEEKLDKKTVEENSVGFNGVDAGFLSDISRRILEDGKGITEAQFKAVKKSLRKYHGQIERFGIDRIELPDTARVYEPRKEKPEGDGLLRIRDEKLEFIPYVFPSVQIKTLGFRYNVDGNKTWTYPRIFLNKVDEVLEMFPNTVIDETLLQWMSEKETLEKLGDLTASSTLFELQKLTVQFMLKNTNCLIALKPGHGKTACAVHAAKEKGGRVLIVCPLTLLRTWKNEIQKWVGDSSLIWHGYISDPSEHTWVITNYDTVVGHLITYDVTKEPVPGKFNADGTPQTKKVKTNWRTVYPFEDFFDTLIIDESILIKNRKSQRTIAVKALAKEFKNVWMLSGSPTSRFYDDLWSQLNCLDPKRVSNYWKFAERYCYLEKNIWGTSVVNNQPDAHIRLQKDFRDMYFTPGDVVDLPEWTFEDLEIELKGEQLRTYTEMEKTFLATLPDGDEVLAPNVLSQMLRLTQLASNLMLVGGPDIGAKWEALPELLDYVQFPIILWTNFIDTAHHLTNKLRTMKFRTATLTGDTQEYHRQLAQEGMQSGKLDAIVAHPGVGKFGLTLTAARTAIYIERSFNGDDYYQSLYRIRRIGTTESPHVIHMIAARPMPSTECTIDRVIARVLEFKRNSSLQITTNLIRQAYSGDLL